MKRAKCTSSQIKHYLPTLTADKSECIDCSDELYDKVWIKYHNYELWHLQPSVHKVRPWTDYRETWCVQARLQRFQCYIKEGLSLNSIINRDFSRPIGLPVSRSKPLLGPSYTVVENKDLGGCSYCCRSRVVFLQRLHSLKEGKPEQRFCLNRSLLLHNSYEYLKHSLWHV
jgi:hypothetical protein